MKHRYELDRYELVASIKRYDGRDDLITWLGRFPTRYKIKKLKQILSESKGKMILWSLENLSNPRKASDQWLEKGVTIL